MGTPTGHPGPYLALPLPLQVHHAHVHNGPQVGEGFHGDHIGALLIAVHIELRRKNTVSPCSTPSGPGRKRLHPNTLPVRPEEAAKGTADEGMSPTGDPNQAGISNEAAWKLVENVCPHFSAEKVQNVHILKGRQPVRPGPSAHGAGSCSSSPTAPSTRPRTQAARTVRTRAHQGRACNRSSRKLNRTGPRQG